MQRWAATERKERGKLSYKERDPACKRCDMGWSLCREPEGLQKVPRQREDGATGGYGWDPVVLRNL